MGVIWMLVTGLNFVAVTALVKYLGSSVPPAQAAFLRYLLGLVFLLPMLGAMRRTSISPRMHLLFAGRGAIHTVGVILWFFAMTQIPLAEVTAMNYLSPIYVTIGAALFLGETMAMRRIAAIGVALIGALIILRPGLSRDLSRPHCHAVHGDCFWRILPAGQIHRRCRQPAGRSCDAVALGDPGPWRPLPLPSG